MKNDSYGLLVGIGALVAAAFIPVACVRLSGLPTSSAMPEFESSAASACAAAQIGVLTSPDLEILAIQPESAAAAAGLQLGDRLVSFGGLPFASQADAIDIMLETELSGPCHDTESISLNPTAVATDMAQVEEAAGVDGLAPIAVATPVPAATEPPIDFHRPIVINRNGAEQSIDLDLSIQPDYATDAPLQRPKGPVQPDWLYF